MEQEEIKTIIEAKERQIQEYRELIKTFKEYDKRRKRHYKAVLEENVKLTVLVAKLKHKLKEITNDKVIIEFENKYKCCLGEKNRLELIIAHNEYVAECNVEDLVQYEYERNVLLLQRQIREQKKELERLELEYQTLYNKYLRLRDGNIDENN